MSLIGGIKATRRRLSTWFRGLALTAQAGIVLAAFVTMSAGVAVGASYTPNSAPWLTPNTAPYGTVQTPSPLRPSIVEAATPTQSGNTGGRSNAKPTVTAAPATVQPTNAPTTVSVDPTSTRTATTMAAATTAAAKAKTKAVATTGPQTSSSVYYKNCAAASKAGAAPITIGQPGYRTELDPNGNGVACEPK